MYDNLSGEPGSLLEEITGIDQQAEYLSQELIKVETSGATWLTAGSDYWLVASVPFGQTLNWRCNSIGQHTTQAYTRDGSYTGWTTQSSWPTAAFRLSYAEANTIPEPATLLLLISGMAGVVCRRRKTQVL